MNISEVRGGAQVMANLNAQIRAIKGGTVRGLIIGANIIHVDTEKTAPLTPVDLGNLRASWFTVTAKSTISGKGDKQFRGDQAGKFLSEHSAAVVEGQGMLMAMETMNKVKGVMCGYTANYAFWVHEMIGMNPAPGYRYGPGPGKKRKYTPRPNAGPKWFEASINRNAGRVLQAVKDNAKIVD